MSTSTRRRLTRIKFDGQKVSIDHDLEVRPGTIDQYSMQCSDPPKPSFIEALRALAPHVARLCECTDLWAKTLDVRGITITWKQTDRDRLVMGACVTCLKTIDCSAAPLCITTPHLPECSYSGQDDGSPVLPVEMRKCIMLLIAEAECYLDGDRLQMALPYGEGGGDQLESGTLTPETGKHLRDARIGSEEQRVSRKKSARAA